MANLNFQQPPRSIASGSLGGGRVGGAAVVGFGGAAAASAAVVAAGAAAVASVPPSGVAAALSPGRGGGGVNITGGTAVPGGGPPMMATRTTLFGQRAFADRRSAVPGGLSAPSSNAMSSMSNLMAGRTAYGSGSGAGVAAAAAAVAAAAGYHSVFGNSGVGGMGGGGDTSTPPLLDLSEFPSLTARGAGDAMTPAQAAPPPGTKPYVGMVKQPTSEQSEFTMSSEDFPALPGTSMGGAAAVGSGAVGINMTSSGSLHRDAPPSSVDGLNSNVDSIVATDAMGVPSGNSLHLDLSSKDKHHRKGIQTSLDGKVTNIPPSMVQNQFGIVGLLTFIRAAEADPDLVSLALGQDLTALGLNLNSPENLHVTFAGPWADTPCRPQDIDYHVPPEYMINSAIREKLAPIKLNRYKDDLLFYLFYCFVGDYLQLYAAQELYNRDWRYHIEEKVWLTQAPGMQMVEKTSTYERGMYYFFDAQNWRKVAKEFHLDYSKLEGRPQVPAHAQT